ncbi:MAG TPA: BatD family protein [Chthoniobacterales bacterium]
MAPDRSRIISFAVALLIAWLGIKTAHADAPTVTAVLTSSETEVDQPVQLQIKVAGDSNATPPNDIAVDGLDIRYTSQSQLVESRNFRFTYSVVYTYTVLPLKAGTFSIPPQVVRTSGGVLRTPALTLNVSPNDDGTTTSRRGGRGGNNAPVDDKKIAFVQLLIPKTTVYMGESIPAEIRIGISDRIPHRLIDFASLSGQGFTSQRMPQPDQTHESINGHQYDVITFKTAITPVRSGKIEITAKDARALVQIPRRGTSRPRSPFDMFGMDDPFNDPFFNDPFAGMGEQREIKLSSDPTKIEVRPLPPHAPPGFSGAVGHFSLTTEVKPKNAQVGDPLTVTATISGRGNFDRVNAPELENDRGWHTYPPSSNFKADDDIGISGTKSFEMVLTPNEPKKAVPPLIFSYFDPLKETYVTLKGDKLPVLVEGTALANPAPAIASAATSAPNATPTAPQAQDILYQRNDHGRWGQNFTPTYLQPAFWAMQAVPLLGLIGFFGWEMRRRRVSDRAAQRRAAWEHELSELERKLRRADDSADQYFAEALRVVQLKTALAAAERGIEPNIVDAEMAVETFGLPNDKNEQVRELFRRSDELRYSGRQNGNGAVAEQTRREVIDLLESLT